MIKYTRAAYYKVKDDLIRLSRAFNLVTPLLSLAYLIYALAVGTGVFIANIIAASVTLVYLIFCIIIYAKTSKSADANLKKKQKRTKKVYKIVRFCVAAFSLGVSIYGLYFTAKNVTVLSVTLVGLSLIAWLLNILIFIICEYVGNRLELLIDGIQYDLEKINPVNTVKNVVNKIQGKETVVDVDKISQKNRDILDELAGKNQKPDIFSRAESFIDRVLSKKRDSDGDK